MLLPIFVFFFFVFCVVFCFFSFSILMGVRRYFIVFFNRTFLITSDIDNLVHMHVGHVVWGALFPHPSCG